MLEPAQMQTQIAGTCMVENDFFLYHSCLVQPKFVRQSTPPSQDWYAGEWHCKIAWMKEMIFFSKAFMFSPIYLRLADVPPPPELNLDLRWARSVRSMSAFYNLPHLSITYFMPDKETCEFWFHMGWGIFSMHPTKHVTPKNEKLNLGICNIWKNF